MKGFVRRWTDAAKTRTASDAVSSEGRETEVKLTGLHCDQLQESNERVVSQ